MKLSEKLVHLRKEKGLTQLELAEALKVSRQAISKWESGVTEPSTENLRCLGNFYGVQIDYLLIDENESYGQKDILKEDVEQRSKKKANGIIVIVLLIIFAVFIFSYSKIKSEREEVTSIEEMESDTIWDHSVSDKFSVDW